MKLVIFLGLLCICIHVCTAQYYAPYYEDYDNELSKKEDTRYYDYGDDSSEEKENKPIPRKTWNSLGFILVTTAGFIIFAVELLDLQVQNLFARSFAPEFKMPNLFESLDPVDLTFGVMDIREMECKERLLCEARKTISVLPLAEYAINNYAPTLKGLQKYGRALNNGQKRENCSRIYKKCEKSIFDYIPKYFMS